MWGAGRVEDTYNLLGHAMRKAVGVVVAQQGRELSDISETMGVTLLSQSSLKAGLDINWDDPEERCEALRLLVHLLDTVTTWLEQGPPPSPVAQAALATAQQIKTQDIELSDIGTPQLKQGVIVASLSRTPTCAMVARADGNGSTAINAISSETSTVA